MADYATLGQLKARLDLNSTDASRDAALEEMITAASRTIDRYCNRLDGFVASDTATARIFTGSGEAVQWIDECVAIATGEVKDSATDDDYTEWESTDWQAFSGDALRPDFNRTPYHALMVTATGDYDVFTSGYFLTRGGFRPYGDHAHTVPTVRVTAQWGYASAVPAGVREACIAQAARWWKRAQSAWADTLGNADMGMLQFRQALDPDIAMMLKHARYIRPVV
jgi:hypothetical protein